MCAAGESAMIAAIAAKKIADITIADLLYEAAEFSTAAQKSIADQIQARANDLHNIWQGSYLPCEIALLDEICSEPIRTANTFAHERRAVVGSTAKFSLAKQQLDYCISPACVGARYEGLYQLSVEQARSEGWVAQIAKRTEVARIDVINGQRLNNRMNISVLGRNGVPNTVAAGAGAAALYQNLADQAAAAFNSASKVAGRVLQMAQSAFLSDSGDKKLGGQVARSGVGESQSMQSRTQTRENWNDFATRNSDDVWNLPLPSNESSAGQTSPTSVESNDGVTVDDVFYPNL